MSGGKIGKIVGSVTKPISKALGVGGGDKTVKYVNEAPSAQDTAQQEVDKKQQITNASTARKKNRSLLSTGAGSSDAGSAKKLLGE